MNRDLKDIVVLGIGVIVFLVVAFLLFVAFGLLFSILPPIFMVAVVIVAFIALVMRIG